MRKVLGPMLSGISAVFALSMLMSVFFVAPANASVACPIGQFDIVTACVDCASPDPAVSFFCPGAGATCPTGPSVAGTSYGYECTCPDGWTNEGTGNGAINTCKRSCTPADVPGSTAVNGYITCTAGDFGGSNYHGICTATQSGCAASTCQSGYSLIGGKCCTAAQTSGIGPNAVCCTNGTVPDGSGGCKCGAGQYIGGVDNTCQQCPSTNPNSPGTLTDETQCFATCTVPTVGYCLNSGQDTTPGATFTVNYPEVCECITCAANQIVKSDLSHPSCWDPSCAANVCNTTTNDGIIAIQPPASCNAANYSGTCTWDSSLHMPNCSSCIQDCGAGYYPDASGNCQTCPDGYWCTGKGKIQCYWTTSDPLHSGNNRSSISDCYMQCWQNSLPANACGPANAGANCPAGQLFYPYTGSCSAAACSATMCAGDFYLNNGACSPCPAGTTHSGCDANACTACQPSDGANACGCTGGQVPDGAGGCKSTTTCNPPPGSTCNNYTDYGHYTNGTVDSSCYCTGGTNWVGDTCYRYCTPTYICSTIANAASCTEWTSDYLAPPNGASISEQGQWSNNIGNWIIVNAITGVNFVMPQILYYITETQAKQMGALGYTDFIWHDVPNIKSDDYAGISLQPAPPRSAAAVKAAAARSSRRVGR